MAHGHDSHGHGHGHGGEGEEIVWHQEKLLPTMLIAVLFAGLALFGLAQAGNTKFSLKMGPDAYNETRSQMPKLESHQTSKNESGHEKVKEDSNHKSAPSDEHKATTEEKAPDHKEEAKTEEHQH